LTRATKEGKEKRTRAAEDSSSTAVERALSILELAGASEGGFTNSQISHRLGLPKSSASYILRTLERRGYLERDAESGRYRLGLRVLALGRHALGGHEIGRLAQPVLRSVIDRTHLTAHLAVLDRGEAVYIEKAEAPGFIRMDTWVGRRMNVHSTSVGKALVAYLRTEEVEAIMREHGLPKRTPKTITSLTRFLVELGKVRQRGYAIDDEENSLGARCVAVPVFGPTGEVEAALGVTGTTTQIEHSSVPKLAELLKDAARRISRQLIRPHEIGAG
jgi:DNA-binding IclR family transcriptional regulator